MSQGANFEIKLDNSKVMLRMPRNQGSGESQRICEKNLESNWVEKQSFPKGEGPKGNSASFTSNLQRELAVGPLWELDSCLLRLRRNSGLEWTPAWEIYWGFSSISVSPAGHSIGESKAEAVLGLLCPPQFFESRMHQCFPQTKCGPQREREPAWRLQGN